MIKVVLLLLAYFRAGAYEPTNIADWIWNKLGMFPDFLGQGTSTLIPTSLGQLAVRTFGERGGRVALAIHGGTNLNSVHREFDPAAVALSEEIGYYVIVPVFHSLRGTSPGIITEPQLVKILHETLHWAGATRFSMLLGKSWGGAMAGRFAAEHPQDVEKLVLVAPGLLRQDIASGRNFSISVPTQLLYSADDSSINRAVMDSVVKTLQKPYYLQMQPWQRRGGHKMTSSYTREILKFAKVKKTEFNDAPLAEEPFAREDGSSSHSGLEL